MRPEKQWFIHSCVKAGDLLREDLLTVLQHTMRLAGLYEAYISSKGVRYLWEADRFVDEHRDDAYPFL